MKGFCLPAGMLHPVILLLGAALIFMTTYASVDAGMAGTHFVTPAAGMELAPNAAVQRIKDAAPAADDTGRNERDRDGQTMTPMDQSNDPDDVKVTREIRQALVADDALSTTAKNIKIITVHGKVILRGPVTTVQEKAKIQKTAQHFTKQLVDNQLEVAPRH
ncbi:MAG: BON domain-containing protein [Nitrospira sp.]